MRVRWLEQRLEDVRLGLDWLSDEEAAYLAGLHVLKRRDDWQLGRWTAKCAVAEMLGRSLDSAVLRNINVQRTASGAPRVLLAGMPALFSISLSHRAGRAACVIAEQCVALGCDLETIEPHSAAFVADYFTASEQAMVASSDDRDRDTLVALLWSAKESVMKVLRCGLNVDTRSIEIIRVENSDAADSPRTPHSTWHRLEARCSDKKVLTGWWSYDDGFVKTLICDNPITLILPA